MRIEKLADNKVIVTLTSDDLDGLNINIHTLHADKVVLNKFLVHVMEVIREETGFNPYSGQIVVEACSMSEGLVITVSKLDESKKISKADFNRAKSIKAKAKKQINRTDTFYFGSFDDICNALIRIDEQLFEKCAVYKHKDKYCMLLSNDSLNKDSKDMYIKTACVLSEYASSPSAKSRQYSHIEECGELIAKGDNLRKMVKGLKQVYS